MWRGLFIIGVDVLIFKIFVYYLNVRGFGGGAMPPILKINIVGAPPIYSIYYWCFDFLNNNCLLLLLLLNNACPCIPFFNMHFFSFFYPLPPTPTPKKERKKWNLNYGIGSGAQNFNFFKYSFIYYCYYFIYQVSMLHGSTCQIRLPLNTFQLHLLS